MKVHKKKLRFRLLRRLFYSLLLKKFFAKAKRILDVGCGEGEFLSSCATHKKGLYRLRHKHRVNVKGSKEISEYG
jgi:2-polyprenyl-3-methyl-5-hydroxy-6-metoxy-1,4-benzoquinol methylase